MNIYIYISTYNRIEITDFVLNNIYENKKNARLIVFDDHSTEYDESFFNNRVDELIINPEKIGQRQQRKRQMEHFLNSNADYIYFTDSDTTHDEDFISKLEYFYNKYHEDKLGICLYNSKYHKLDKDGNYLNNVIDVNDEIYIKRYAGGNSMFFDKKSLNEIYNKSNIGVGKHSGWDWTVGEFLRGFVTPKIGYCDHFPWGGMNATLDDVAMDTTEYLKKERINFLRLNPKYK